MDKLFKMSNNLADVQMPSFPRPLNAIRRSTIPGRPRSIYYGCGSPNSTCYQLTNDFEQQFGATYKANAGDIFVSPDGTVIWQLQHASLRTWTYVIGSIAPTLKINKDFYIFENTDVTFSNSELVQTPQPIPIGWEFDMDLTEHEMKFAYLPIFAPDLFGSLEKNNTNFRFRYIVDNTGWYLEIDAALGKIVIPSSKLPYVSDTWKAYQMREMEYDRAERDRAIRGARDKFMGDVARGFTNGALAAGLSASTATFAPVVGGIAVISSILGAASDRSAAISDAKMMQENKEKLMYNAIDTYYNGGYGYRLIFSDAFVVRVAMPVEDMDETVLISGYSCTGNMETALEKGYLQGTPEPSSEIKGTLKDILISEIQMGVWLL